MTDAIAVEPFADPVLRAAVSEALRSIAPHARLAGANGDARAIADEHWKLAVEMGWPGAAIDEAAGGLGIDALHVADLCEEMGRHLFCGPFVETAVLLPALARHAGGRFAELLDGVIAGTVRMALVEVDTSTMPAGAAWEVAPVDHAAFATHLAVLARDGAGQVGVSVVEAGAAAIEPLQAMDPTTPVGRVRLAAPPDAVVIRLDAGSLRRIMAPVHVAVAAEQLGIGEAALARVVGHVRTRSQFGGPIGRFQAIKHRLADAHTALTGARLAVAHAAGHAGDAGAAELARVIAADAAMRIAADSIQFHGGMGFSWEMDAHLYLKRALRLQARHGGAARLRKAAGDTFIDAVIARAAPQPA
jgi:alkylation response protein AidB-like acyl-CoA dehydrogenase